MNNHIFLIKYFSVTFLERIRNSVWPWQHLKVLTEAEALLLVLLLVLAWKHDQKTFHIMEKKNVREQNVFQIEQRMSQKEQKIFAFKNYSKLKRKSWTENKKFHWVQGNKAIVSFYCFSRPFVALCDLIWPFYCLVWLLWLFMA